MFYAHLSDDQFLYCGIFMPISFSMRDIIACKVERSVKRKQESKIYRINL